ncbi:hypothetical protein HMPREF1549_02443 [Actinomyces johnsonii F0510]|uniref:Uncharacterized protein n=1 Tax=Actinomyces johnsonii F0510 TaxID=1227262 RepID=U1RB20_9ACTO|nr:hypothetical protein HMPREF1549_02443 [Actinomyces johnsonii F0510]
MLRAGGGCHLISSLVRFPAVWWELRPTIVAPVMGAPARVDRP